MSDDGLDRLRERGQAFSEEISREGYLAYSGLKASADLQTIYAKYRDVLNEESLALALDAFHSAKPGSEELRSARSLLEWQVESAASQQLAALDEKEIEWEGSAVLRTRHDEEISYQAAPIEIGNSKDRDRRIAIDDARADIAEREHSPLRLERLQREKEIIEQLQVAPDYNSTFEALTGISLGGLASECAAFLRDTDAMWHDVLPPVLKKSLGLAVGDATRADAIALLRASEFDGAFPGSSMETTIRAQMNEMGIDATAGGRVIFDVGERPGKRSRAFCSPVRVPDEVYLVLRPHGGQSDYTTFLHELGHALHFAYARRDYSFEFRWLGDNSVTEAYAMLMDHRMQDRGWLLRYSGLGSSHVDEFLRSAGFEELHFLRRYCAKFLYEVQVYSGDLDWRQMPDLYVETLSSATTFKYRPVDAFIDLDPRFYSARYLRAWQLQSVIDESLVNRFDIDWFRNPGAGPWLVRELLAEGQRETADEIAQRAGGSLSFSPLIRKIEKLLGS
ncbi:MAG: hypothetical protein H0W69_02500 [Gemmatimonadaceae bacterium]|nr:hypothetical protein [Gemmatimonadaceae bacterium]